MKLILAQPPSDRQRFSSCLQAPDSQATMVSGAASLNTGGPEGIGKGQQSFLLQIDITEVVMHEADEPDAVIDFFDSYCLAQTGAEIDLLAIETKATSRRRHVHRRV